MAALGFVFLRLDFRFPAVFYRIPLGRAFPAFAGDRLCATLEGFDRKTWFPAKTAARLPAGFYRIPLGRTSCATLEGFGRKTWFPAKTAARLPAILAVRKASSTRPFPS